jgi:hypothetical protein
MHAHRFGAESWAWARYVLGVPAAVLAAVAGYFALGEDNLGWGGLMAVAAALLTTLLTTLKPGEEVSRHQQAAARFGDVRRRAVALASVGAASDATDDALSADLDALLAAFAVAEQEAPNLTHARRVRGTRYVDDGEPAERGPVAQKLGTLAWGIAVTLAAAFVLLIVNWFLRGVLDREVPGGLWGGLVFALIIFGAAFAGLWRVGHSWRRALATGAVVAFAFVFLLPLAIASPEAGNDAVTRAGPIRSRLDVVLIVSERTFSPSEASIPPRVGRPPWSIHYSVAVRGSKSLRWRLAESESRDAALLAAAGAFTMEPVVRPTFRDDADRIILLVPDPIPPAILLPKQQRSTRGSPGELDDWLGSLRASGLEVAPTFVLLATDDQARVRRWGKAVSPTGGGAFTLAELGSQALTDAAELLASDSAASSSDFALAFRHRPRLLFSSKERVDNWPLNIDAFFASGLVHLCTTTTTGTDECPVVRSAANLQNGGTHLRIDYQRQRPIIYPSSTPLARSGLIPPPPPTGSPALPPSEVPSPPPSVPPPGAAGSAIYFNVVYRPAQGRILLDYWWYLPYNPSVGLNGAFCGPGFTIAGLTCFDHQSDWEGVVVTLDNSTSPPRPLSVGYAQHERVVTYAWPLLQRRWSLSKEDFRPRVFIARNSHAAYPFRCAPPVDPPCRQLIDPRPEGRHDGRRLWPYNEDLDCEKQNCLLPFPTRAQGREPALWNAFDGSWGEQRCILRIYCDIGAAPRAPSHQKRFRDPTRSDRQFGFVSS